MGEITGAINGKEVLTVHLAILTHQNYCKRQ